MKAEVINDAPKRIVSKANTTLGILNYDADNLYPQRVDKLLADSNTGSSCLRVKTRFIIGKGLADPTVYKTKVNAQGLRFDAMHRKLANDLAKFDVFAVLVKPDLELKPLEVYPLQYKDLRLAIDAEKKVIPGIVKLYDNWDGSKGKIKKDDIDTLPLWTDDQEAINEALADPDFKGFVYLFTMTPGEYSVAPFDPVLEDMATEGELKAFRKRTVKSNFLASHVFKTGKKEDDAAAEFKESIEDFQGGKNAAKALIIELEDEDDFFSMEKVDVQNFDDLYTNTTSTAKESIVENFQIPKALLLKSAASVGTSNEIEDAKELYNDLTEDDRLRLTEAYTIIFKDFDGIPEGADFTVLPIAVKKVIEAPYFPYATRNEVRESINLPIEEEQQAAEGTLFEKIGVGGTQALVAVVSDTVLSQEQKKATLSTVFGMSEDDANKILGL